jgi:hypothetical protein
MQRHSDGALRLSQWSARPLRKRLELIRLEDESLDTTPRAFVTTGIPWRAVLSRGQSPSLVPLRDKGARYPIPAFAIALRTGRATVMRRSGLTDSGGVIHWRFR